MTTNSLLELPARLTRPSSSEGARFIMGIDGGATKTLAAVLDLDSMTLHCAHGGSSNEDSVGAKAAVDTLLDVAQEAIERAGITHTDLTGAVLAIAGTDTDAIRRHVSEARADDWIVVNDVVAAWAAATGTRPGVGVISGTGSNVFGVGPTGQTWRAGGWGHLLGDEGSGYWFGLHSIRAALREREATGPATALSGAVLSFFRADSVEEVATRVYSQPLTKPEIAAFASEAAKAAQGGDRVARELYESGARELGQRIAVVIDRTGLAGDSTRSGDEFPVGLIGSAFKAGPVFIDPLVRYVTERAPLAGVSVVEMTPVGGSLLLAARACGRALEPRELSRVLDASVASHP